MLNSVNNPINSPRIDKSIRSITKIYDLCGFKVTFPFSNLEIITSFANNLEMHNKWAKIN